MLYQRGLDSACAPGAHCVGSFLCAGCGNGEGHVAPVYAKWSPALVFHIFIQNGFWSPWCLWVSPGCFLGVSWVPLVAPGCLLGTPGYILGASWLLLGVSWLLLGAFWVLLCAVECLPGVSWMLLGGPRCSWMHPGCLLGLPFGLLPSLLHL